MEMLPIRRGAEPPPRTHRKPLKGVYHFGDMAVGEWFEAPRDMGKDNRGRDKRQRSIVSSAYLWRKRRGMHIVFETYLSESTVVCRRVK